jgi:hypothetical protein
MLCTYNDSQVNITPPTYAHSHIVFSYFLSLLTHQNDKCILQNRQHEISNKATIANLRYCFLLREGSELPSSKTKRYCANKIQDQYDDVIKKNVRRRAYLSSLDTFCNVHLYLLH